MFYFQYYQPLYSPYKQQLILLHTYDIAINYLFSSLMKTMKLNVIHVAVV